MTALAQVALAALAVVAALVALSYPLHAWLALRRRRTRREGSLRLSVLVPLRGAPATLAENLGRLVTQRLPRDSEILWCVESASDPAAAVVRAVLAATGATKARLVVAGPPGELLAKIHNLEAGLRKASGDVVVLLDQDAHLPHERFLAELCAPLDDASVGMVTAFPWYVDAQRPAAALLAAMVNTDLLGTFALRAIRGNLRFANGTCMAVRGDALAAAGGVRWLGRRMLVDSALAERVAARGRRVVLHPEPVLVRCEAGRAADVWNQARRWHLSLRHGLHPLTYLAFGWLRSPLVLALAAWGLEPRAAFAPGLVLGVLACRWIGALGLAAVARTASRSLASLVVLPLADLVNPLVWAASWIGSTMTWHGRRYRMSRGARLEPLSATPRSPAATLARIGRFTRVSDWGIQLPILALAATLVACAHPVDPAALLQAIAWACLVQALLLCGGYALNDLTDRVPDAIKGAPAWSARAWRIRRWFAAAFLLAGLLLAAGGGVTAVTIAAVQVAGGAAYSMAPLRLKSRGLAGVIAAALLQRLPGVALVWSQLAPDAPAAIAASIWLAAIGVVFILEHQLEDFDADGDAGVRTWTRDVGRAQARASRGDARLVAGLAAMGGAFALLAPVRSAAAPAAILGAAAWVVADLVGGALIARRYRADRRAPRRLPHATPRPDVRIFGAGLAGLAAALRLARWGMRVEVHEQRRGAGGMAETIPTVHSAQLVPAALARRLGLPIGRAFHAVERETVHWERRSFEVPPCHVHCLRGARAGALDRLLLEAALEAGVVVRFGSPLRVASGPGPGPCIVATGLSRAGAMAFDLPAESIHGWVASEPWTGPCELHTFRRRAFGRGYGYVANALGIRSALLFSRSPLDREARAVFERDLDRRLGWRPRGFVPLHGAIPGHPCFARGETLLAGTLAGMIDPFYLSGVEAALVSGVIAAHGVVDRDGAERAFARATRCFGLQSVLASLAWSDRAPWGVSLGAALVGSSVGRVGSLRWVA